uniref:DNA replication licensing factor MCM3 n=1 Tax=Aureoumbra lagunensis TaxID=44058 RepID=A0A7S3JYH6_9STRA
MAASEDNQTAQIDAATFTNIKNLFVDFIISSHGSACRDKAHELINWSDDEEKAVYRLPIDVADLRRFDAGLAQRFIQNPLLHLTAWKEALKSWMLQHSDTSKIVSESMLQGIKIGLIGSFGSRLLTPRQLRSSHLGEYVCIQGVVTHSSLTLPKVLRSVYWLEETKEHFVRDHQDASSLDLWLLPPSTVSSTLDYAHDTSKHGSIDMNDPTVVPYYMALQRDNKDELIIDHGLTAYMDHQYLTIQEAPEVAPYGQLPRSVTVLLQDDLVDIARPGDRVSCTGVFRALPSNNSKYPTAFSPTLLANYVTKIEHDHKQILAEKNETLPTSLIRSPNIHAPLAILLECFAPSVHGSDAAKKALIMQLVGGTEKVLASGTRLRGDINILLVGDPSTAKSQLLRATMRAAPLAISTTGRGSSGVGLTASIGHDTETGERRLEAGAVILADRGVVCIDEFDKMSTGDRIAIHEVMEQQTVTLAKAGIHATLNARCAVLAAANPIYGQYDINKRPQENIGLPDSLLSRFDLIILTLDDINAVKDQAIAEHVLHLHRRSGISSADTNTISDNQDTSRIAWFQNRILFAKYQIQPKLTDEARSCIANLYAELRSRADDRTLPITARCLESLIRLATAHAKIHHSENISISDCDFAFNILSTTIFGDSDTKEAITAENNNDIEQAREQIDIEMNDVVVHEPRRENIISQTLAQLQQADVSDGIVSVNNLLVALNATLSDSPNAIEFSSAEVDSVLKKLADQNRIMYDEEHGEIHAC